MKTQTHLLELPRPVPVRIEAYRASHMTERIIHAVADLTHRCFPSAPQTLEQRIEELRQRTLADHPEFASGLRWIVWDEERPIAHAYSFVRHISVAGEWLPVLALAAVCTDPEYRGDGWGATLCRRAFARLVDPAMPDVCLFQTPVPDFYVKLDCRQVENRFFNSLDPDDPDRWPWNDPTAMIFPAEFPWPSGEVDLRGPAY